MRTNLSTHRLYKIAYLITLSCLSFFVFSSCNDSIFIDSISPNESARSRACEDQYSETYYYYHHEKLPVLLDTTKIYVVVRDNSNSEFNTVSPLKLSDNDESNYTGFIMNKADFEKSTYLHTRTSESKEIISLEDVTHDGVAISHIFYVLMKSADDLDELSKIADEIGCKILGSSNWNKNLIKLSTSTESKFRSLGACRYIIENGDFEFADPCFLVKDRPLYSPNDPQYSLQWNFKNPQTVYKGINILPAWEITRGSSSINLAIWDYGFDSNNPEFSSHLHSFSYGPQNAISGNDSTWFHGNMVASIAAASHNDYGIAGVAPNVKLMNINLSNLSNSNKNHADIVNDMVANGADVINMSFYFNQGYYSETFENALNYAISNGRSGKGTVIVLCAGNDPNSFAYPAKAINKGIRVGATKSDGSIWEYSSRGSEVDVVAPGASIPVIKQNEDITFMYGTSFAAPHVSGLAALILSVRPDLTAAKVKQLIIETASRSTHSNDYGWGLINAGYALEALTHKFSFVKPAMTANTVYTQAGGTFTYTLSGVPRGAKTVWESRCGSVKSSNYNSATIAYPKIGRYSECINATVTYMGQSSTYTFEGSVMNPDEITDIRAVDIDDRPGYCHLYVECTEENPELEWELLSGSGFTLEDFYFQQEADYISNYGHYVTLVYGTGSETPNYGASCRLKVSFKGYAESKIIRVNYDGSWRASIE